MMENIRIPYHDELADLFTSSGGIFYFVELNATLEKRLERKPSKRNVEWSKPNLLNDAQNHRLNSNEGEIWFTNHLKIDNTNLSPYEVADIVIEKFQLVANKKKEKEYRFGL